MVLIVRVVRRSPWLSVAVCGGPWRSAPRRLRRLREIFNHATFMNRSALTPSTRRVLHPYICLSIHTSIRSSVHPSVRPSARPSVRPSVHPAFRSSLRPIARPSTRTAIPSITNSVVAAAPAFGCPAEHAFLPHRLHQHSRRRRCRLRRRCRRRQCVFPSPPPTRRSSKVYSDVCHRSTAALRPAHVEGIAVPRRRVASRRLSAPFTSVAGVCSKLRLPQDL